MTEPQTQERTDVTPEITNNISSQVVENSQSYQFKHVHRGPDPVIESFFVGLENNSQTQQFDEFSQTQPNEEDEATWPVYDKDSYESHHMFAENYMKTMRKLQLAYPKKPLTAISPETYKSHIYGLIRIAAAHGICLRALFLSISIFNQYFTKNRSLAPEELETYGIAALIIGAKIDNTNYPHSIVYEGSNEDLQEAETRIIKDFGFKISESSPLVFLKFWMNEIQADFKLVMSSLFVSMCSMIIGDLVKYEDEAVGVACLCLALSANGMHPIEYSELSEPIKLYGGEKLTRIMNAIVEAIKEVKSDSESPIARVFANSVRGEALALTYAVPDMRY